MNTTTSIYSHVMHYLTVLVLCCVVLPGAVANMFPSLFKAVVADVPFVDVTNTMSDPTIPLTVTEWEEVSPSQ